MPIAKFDDQMHRQKQLERLADHVTASANPPIAEIEEMLQEYLSTSALPTKKASPSDADKRAFQLAVFAFIVVTVCDGHFHTDRKLDSCFLNAWPGIWRWLQFLDEQCCRRVKYGDKGKIQALITIASSLATISVSKSLRREVQSTPGVVAMLTRHWKDEGRFPEFIQKVLEAGDTGRPFTGALNALLNAGDLAANCLPDVVAASGGAKSAATTAIERLNAVLAEKPPHFPTIHSHISLLNNFSCHKDPEIVRAMLGGGMILTLVKTFVWLEEQSPSASADKDKICQCMNACLYTLANAMTVVNGPSRVVQALHAGLLPAVLKSASRMDPSSDRRIAFECSRLLFDILCQYLVYREVIRSAERALKTVERFRLDDTLGGPIKAAWDMFKTLSQKRTALKERFDAGDDGPQRRCDRVKVSAPVPSTILVNDRSCKVPISSSPR